MCFRPALIFRFRADIKILEKQFAELESRISLQNPTQGLSLRELVNMSAAQVKSSLAGAQSETVQTADLHLQLAQVCVSSWTLDLLIKWLTDKLPR